MPANISPSPPASASLPAWIQNRLIVSLIPIAQGAGLKLLTRLASYLALAFTGIAAKNGVEANVETLSGALISLGAVGLDVLISVISYKLHVVAKAEAVN